MGNSDLTNSENILIKTDENNLIYVDPNSVLINNQVQPRSVAQEKLVVYVNLEADIIPRTILASNGDTNSLRSIARGTLNFLSSQTTTDSGDRSFTTDWTESYTDRRQRVDNKGKVIKDEFYTNDGTGQSFGIESISIQIKGANFIPQVVINFVDVRGKTLFESPENSPYKAFFHIPWPIFYLTIKGYYGKALRYRLHLVSFSSRFNSNNGNFEVTTKFVGSTYAFMTDIPLKAILNAPFMYVRTVEGSETFNEQTGFTEKKAIKSSKGYQILQSVFAEMKQKKLIPQDLPVKTLREICVLSSTLDKKLEQQIFDQVIDPEFLDGLRAYREVLKNFEIKINGWKNKFLDITAFEPTDVESQLGYYLKAKEKDNLINVTGATTNGTLENIINSFTEQLKKYQNTFNTKVKKDGVTINTKILSNSLPPIKTYFNRSTKNPANYLIYHDKLISDIQAMKKVFFEQNSKIEKEIENRMNEFFKDPSKGLGFEPTVRNLFGILLANAEVYVRLMKDIHNEAFNVSEERKKYIGNFDEQSVGDSIYPWPEIKKTTGGAKQKVIAYPGEPELQSKLRSFSSTLWPEVGFIEEFIGVSSNVRDPLVEKEGGVNDLQYIFESNKDESRAKEISTFFQVQKIVPYSDRVLVPFLYQLYERIKQATFVDSFRNDTLLELANIEFQSIQEIVGEELDILYVLKNEITSLDKLIEYLQKLSPYERFPNYLDSVPTTQYISETVSKPFLIEQYVPPVETNQKTFDTSLYTKLADNLKNYTPESYRKNIYPFNSKKYLSYINKEKFTDDEFKFNDIFRIGEYTEFIETPFNSFTWVKPTYRVNNVVRNIFNQKLFIGDNYTHLLNTPYFHKQLYSDFFNTTSFGKYAGSAYLLLNSLPFLDLKDEINFVVVNNNSVFTNTKKIRMSSLFREIGSVHYLPYHLVAKWGSIYHRYKKKILDGVDILTGFTTSNTNTTTTNINGNKFFNDNETGPTFTTFTFNNTGVTYSNNKDVGIHPYYDAIYHQIVNGYNHYVVASGNTSFSGNTANGSIKGVVRQKENGLNYWTQYVDNSKYDTTDLKYTVLPCDGGNKYINLKDKPNGIQPSDYNFSKTEQFNFRILWEDEYINESFSGKTFFKHDEYNISEKNDIYELDTNNKKVHDLIATFGPQILEKFEDIFLQFASEYVEVEDTRKLFQKVKYDNFQILLKDLVTVSKNTNDTNVTEDIILKIKERQIKKLEEVTEELLSENNNLKLTLGNPKELDPYVVETYCRVSPNPLRFNEYDFASQSGNTKYLDLYVGTDPDNPVINNSYYLNFFETSNIELREENILLLRPLILIYGGWYRSKITVDTGYTPTYVDFSNYLKNSILDRGTTNNQVGGANNRLQFFMTQLISNFRKLELVRNDTSINFIDGYNNRQLKVELYNTFKSFNDKWVAGNSIGQRLLFEEFLFLDKANRDIGDKTYLNLTRFASVVDSKNDKANLYSTISMLLQGTGFDMRALPAYVNFYGTNISNRSKITPSKLVAKNLFGTFLDVDYVDSSPKIIVQYVGPTSKHAADMDKSSYKFKDDSFDISNRNKNPLIVTLPEIYDLDQLNKSNKVVAFEVSFGDQYQNIFKGVTLDTNTVKNTSESFVVLENLARSESGAGAYNVDVSLFDLYKQQSYSCEVSCMGNAMIQPTMYFYLKNIPMFRGTYWITEVSHQIRNNSIETVFRGTRIPVASLPDPQDSFISSFKSLFDKITNSARLMVKKLNESSNTSSTEQTIRTGNGNFVTDMGGVKIEKENLLNEAGITEFGIPYNGFGNEKFIQKVKYQQKNGQTGTWYRAKVARMGMESKIYTISDTTHMSLLSKLRRVENVNSEGETGLKWSELKVLTDSKEFYSTKFQITGSITADKIITGVTEFLNPNLKDEKIHVVNPKYELDRRVEALDVSGPVNVGPFVDGYGIALSNKLMKTLNIQEGQVVYFRIK